MSLAPSDTVVEIDQESRLHEVEKKDDTITDASTQPVDEPPEGGLQAWLVVVGVFFANWIAFGYTNAYGVLYRAYNTDASPFHYAGKDLLGLIGGFGVGFSFLMGPIANLLLRKYGVRGPVTLGVLCMTLGLELASLANAWWQLMLAQGMLFGIGASLVFIPAISLPSQYFTKRRGLATGIGSSGTSIGALVLAPVTQAVIDRTGGTAWALRTIGFITLFLGMFCILLLRPRAQQSVRYDSFDLSVFKVPGFVSFLVVAFLTMLGYVIPLFFVSTFCATLGISGIQSSAVISLIAAGNFIGRLSSGFLADVVGTLNTLAIFTFLNGLLSIVFWQFARSFAAMAVFGILWGITAGAYWSLSVPVSGKIVGLPRLGSAVSFVFLMNVVPPIISGPIGSAILATTARNLGTSQQTPEAYRYLIIFSGLVNVCAGLILASVRIRLFKGFVA